MPTESTLKQYKLRITRLEKDEVNAINNPESLFKWFQKEELSPSSQKVYLSALKNANQDSFPKVLQDKLNELYQNQNKKDMEQTLTDKQQANFVEWKELVAVQKKLSDKENKTDSEWKQYLVASLYTLNAPVRADYGEMEVHKKYNSERTGNEIIWGIKKPVFVFRVYKTAKTYGEVKIDISKPLQDVIESWFDHLGGIPKYLIGDTPSNTNTFAIYVAETFKRHTGKTVGVSLIRHSYITDVYPSLKTLKQKEAVANNMLHSRDLQEKYNLPKETKDDEIPPPLESADAPIRQENKERVVKKEEGEGEEECPICKKKFKNVALHVSKAHTKDMWKIVIPKKLTDEKNEIALYNFGTLIDIQSSGLSGSDDKGQYLGYTFEIRSANTIKNISGLFIYVYVDDDEQTVLQKIHPSVTYYKEEDDGVAELKSVDKANVTIEYVDSLKQELKKEIKKEEKKEEEKKQGKKLKPKEIESAIKFMIDSGIRRYIGQYYEFKKGFNKTKLAQEIIEKMKPYFDDNEPDVGNKTQQNEVKEVVESWIKKNGDKLLPK